MAIARFKDLVLDAADAPRLGAFWAQVLDWQWHLHDGPAYGWVGGCTPERRIWINQVPEPRAVKNRVHFDIYATNLSELEELGARVVEPFRQWTVMADPEGTLFCAYLRDELPLDRMHGLAVDSVDPLAIAQWWAGVYDVPVQINRGGWTTLSPVPGMPILTMDFNAVPEPKTVKNRIHWDVWVTDLQLLLDAGARLLRARDADIEWHVLADPEGNEFCAFESGAAATA